MASTAVRVMCVGVVTVFAASIGSGISTIPATSAAAECVKPDPLPLPLSRLSNKRAKFKAYKTEVGEYRDCAGSEADPAVEAHYKKAVAQYTRFVRASANRHHR